MAAKTAKTSTKKLRLQTIRPALAPQPPRQVRHHVQQHQACHAITSLLLVLYQPTQSVTLQMLLFQRQIAKRLK